MTDSDSIHQAKKVQVWIYRWDAAAKENLFLLLKTNPRRGGFWQPVTGSVDSGESLQDAAVREAREETGLDFIHPAVQIPFSFQFEGRGKRITESGFSLQAPQQSNVQTNIQSKVQLDPAEHSDYQWVTAAQAFQMLGYPSNAQMLKSLLTQIAP